MKDTQETKSEVIQVTGFLDVYATQISPGKDASVYSDPVFSWQLSSGDPSQFRYGVELFGEGFYWRSDKSDQTTISYSGQDLQSGPYKFFIEISDRYTNRFSLTEGGPFFYGTLAKAEVKGSVKTMAPGYEAGIQGATITLKKIDISGNEEVVSSMSKSYSAITVEDGDYSKLFFDVDIEKKRIRASERLVLTVGYTGHAAFSFSHDIDTSFGHDVIIHLPVASRGR